MPGGNSTAGVLVGCFELKPSSGYLGSAQASLEPKKTPS